MRGDQLEEALAEHGLTVGLYPQSIAISTVGGWIAASSAGQASTGFGAIEDVLLGLTAVLPEGEILRCKPVPRSAAGPDLRRLLIGSEGTLAVVTEATLACRARPASWDWLAFAFPEFTALADGLRHAVRAQTGAAVIRGYDETDAQLSFGALGHAGGCVGLLGFPVGLPGLAARKQAAAEAMQRAGVSSELGARYGKHWWQHRNDAVQTYAQIMGPERAFGSGVIVDTFEVAGLWSAVPAAVHGHPGGPGRARPGGGLSPVPSVPVRLVAVLHVPGQRHRRSRGGDAVPCGLGSGCAKLRRRGRNHHAPSRRRPPEGRLPGRRTRRDRSGGPGQDQGGPRPGQDHEPAGPAAVTVRRDQL